MIDLHDDTGHWLDTAAAPCPRCRLAGARDADASTGINFWCEWCEAWFARCDQCGTTYVAPQSPYCKDGHGGALTYHPFIRYFDFALGQEVTSLAQRWGFMRGEIDQETGERRGQLEYRDKMSAGELSARRDRVEAQRKERARG